MLLLDHLVNCAHPCHTLGDPEQCPHKQLHRKQDPGAPCPQVDIP